MLIHSPSPATFYAGEVVDIYVHVLQRDAKFRGLLMNAVGVDHNGTKIGSWEFTKGNPNPLYWFGLPVPASVSCVIVVSCCGC